MRLYQPIVIAFVGVVLASASSAQKAPVNSKASIIAAMKDPAAAPPEDIISRPGVTEKGFSLGLSGTANKTSAQPGKAHNRVAQRRTGGGSRSALTYGRPLDMRVSFGLNSAELTEQGAAEVRIFADAIKSPELAGQRFIVAGHTDTSGTARINDALSKRRAQSVVDFLATHGVDRSRLLAAGFGSERPRPNTSPADPSNRRVEFARTN